MSNSIGVQCILPSISGDHVARMLADMRQGRRVLVLAPSTDHAIALHTEVVAGGLQIGELAVHLRGAARIEGRPAFGRTKAGAIHFRTFGGPYCAGRGMVADVLYIFDPAGRFTPRRWEQWRPVLVAGRPGYVVRLPT